MPDRARLTVPATVPSVNVFVCIKPQVRGRDVAYAADTGQPIRPTRVHIGETDEVALQAALDLRNRQGGRVTVVSIVERRTDACLEHCLARGADRALRIDYAQAGGEWDPVAVARLAAEVIRSERADVVFCASRSGDLGSGFFPYALARAASYGLVTRIIDFDVAGDGVTAVRKLERGWRERYEIGLPAVLAVEDELTRPRHVAVLGRSHRQAMALQVERRAAAAGDTKPESKTALREVALTLPQPRRRPVLRSKPRGSARDRLRRKRPTGDGKGQAVRLDGDPQEIGRQLVSAIRGWLDRSTDGS